jgi:hypothetical protein
LAASTNSRVRSSGLVALVIGTGPPHLAGLRMLAFFFSIELAS